MTKPSWLPIEDDAAVERLIPAIQQAIASVYDQDDGADQIGVHAGDTANVLLMLLASLLEQHPGAATPRAMRGLAEAAGKELHRMMRDTRVLRHAEQPGTIN